MPGLDARWRKSSFSGSGDGGCVDAASHDGAVVVRDSKQHGHGQTHRYTPAEWRAFLGAVMAGTTINRRARRGAGGPPGDLRLLAASDIVTI